MTAPRLAIIMSALNCADYIQESVASVLQQDFADFVFYIVDDGSCDATPEKLRGLAQKDSRITLWADSQRLGITARLNQLINLCETEYIARMDADDISLPGRFSAQIEYLDSHPIVGVAGTWAVVMDSEGNRLFSKHYPTSNNWIVKQLTAGQNVLAHGSVMIRRSVLKTLTIPTYRPSSVQDLDLWLRLSRTTQFALLPIEGYAVRNHVRSITFGQQKIRRMQLEYLLGVFRYEAAASTSIPVEDLRTAYDHIAHSAVSGNAPNEETWFSAYKIRLIQGDIEGARKALATASGSHRRTHLFKLIAMLPSSLIRILLRGYYFWRDPHARYKVYL